MELPVLFSSLYRDYSRPILIVLAVLLVLHAMKVVLTPYCMPWLLNRFSAKYNRVMDRFKEELFQELQSLLKKSGGDEEAGAENGNASPPQPSLTILEIGVGTGANFKYYPDGAVVIAVEPNENFAGYLARSVAEHSPRVRLARTVVGYAEDLRGQVEDGAVDAVVCTLVLCSVRDVDAVIREAKRVLKPGGQFYFLEHVSGQLGSWIRTVQWLLHPVWAYLGEGCHLTRMPWLNVDRAGFSRVHHKRFSAPLKLPVLRPHLMGVATK